MLQKVQHYNYCSLNVQNEPLDFSIAAWKPEQSYDLTQSTAHKKSPRPRVHEISFDFVSKEGEDNGGRECTLVARSNTFRRKRLFDLSSRPRNGQRLDVTNQKLALDSVDRVTGTVGSTPGCRNSDMKDGVVDNMASNIISKVPKRPISVVNSAKRNYHDFSSSQKSANGSMQKTVKTGGENFPSKDPPEEYEPVEKCDKQGLKMTFRRRSTEKPLQIMKEKQRQSHLDIPKLIVQKCKSAKGYSLQNRNGGRRLKETSEVASTDQDLEKPVLSVPSHPPPLLQADTSLVNCAESAESSTRQGHSDIHTPVLIAPAAEKAARRAIVSDTALCSSAVRHVTDSEHVSDTPTIKETSVKVMKLTNERTSSLDAHLNSMVDKTGKCLDVLNRTDFVSNFILGNDNTNFVNKTAVDDKTNSSSRAYTGDKTDDIEKHNLPCSQTNMVGRQGNQVLNGGCHHKLKTKSEPTIDIAAEHNETTVYGKSSNHHIVHKYKKKQKLSLSQCSFSRNLNKSPIKSKGSKTKESHSDQSNYYIREPSTSNEDHRRCLTSRGRGQGSIPKNYKSKSPTAANTENSAAHVTSVTVPAASDKIPSSSIPQVLSTALSLDKADEHPQISSNTSKKRVFSESHYCHGSSKEFLVKRSGSAPPTLSSQDERRSWPSPQEQLPELYPFETPAVGESVQVVFPLSSASCSEAATASPDRPKSSPPTVCSDDVTEDVDGSERKSPVVVLDRLPSPVIELYSIRGMSDYSQTGSDSDTDHNLYHPHNDGDWGPHSSSDSDNVRTSGKLKFTYRKVSQSRSPRIKSHTRIRHSSSPNNRLKDESVLNTAVDDEDYQCRTKARQKPEQIQRRQQQGRASKEGVRYVHHDDDCFDLFLDSVGYKASSVLKNLSLPNEDTRHADKVATKTQSGYEENRQEKDSNVDQARHLVDPRIKSMSAALMCAYQQNQAGEKIAFKHRHGFRPTSKSGRLNSGRKYRSHTARKVQGGESLRRHWSKTASVRSHIGRGGCRNSSPSATYAPSCRHKSVSGRCPLGECFEFPKHHRKRSTLNSTSGLPPNCVLVSKENETSTSLLREYRNVFESDFFQMSSDKFSSQTCSPTSSPGGKKRGRSEGKRGRPRKIALPEWDDSFSSEKRSALISESYCSQGERQMQGFRCLNAGLNKEASLVYDQKEPAPCNILQSGGCEKNSFLPPISIKTENPSLAEGCQTGDFGSSTETFVDTVIKQEPSTPSPTSENYGYTNSSSEYIRYTFPTDIKADVTKDVDLMGLDYSQLSRQKTADPTLDESVSSNSINDLSVSSTVMTKSDDVAVSFEDIGNRFKWNGSRKSSQGSLDSDSAPQARSTSPQHGILYQYSLNTTTSSPVTSTFSQTTGSEYRALCDTSFVGDADKNPAAIPMFLFTNKGLPTPRVLTGMTTEKRLGPHRLPALTLNTPLSIHVGNSPGDHSEYGSPPNLIDSTTSPCTTCQHWDRGSVANVREFEVQNSFKKSAYKLSRLHPHSVLEKQVDCTNAAASGTQQTSSHTSCPKIQTQIPSITITSTPSCSSKEIPTLASTSSPVITSQSFFLSPGLPFHVSSRYISRSTSPLRTFTSQLSPRRTPAGEMCSRSTSHVLPRSRLDPVTTHRMKVQGTSFPSSSRWIQGTVGNKSAQRCPLNFDGYESDDSDATLVYPRAEGDPRRQLGKASRRSSVGLSSSCWSEGSCPSALNSPSMRAGEDRNSSSLLSPSERLDQKKSELSMLVSDLRETISKTKALKRSRRTNSFSGDKQPPLMVDDTGEPSKRPPFERFMSVEPHMDSDTPYARLTQGYLCGPEVDHVDFEMLHFVSELQLLPRTPSGFASTLSPGSTGGYLACGDGSSYRKLEEAVLLEEKSDNLSGQKEEKEEALSQNIKRELLSLSGRSGVEAGIVSMDETNSPLQSSVRQACYPDTNEGRTVTSDVTDGDDDDERPLVVIENAESDEVIEGDEVAHKMWTGSYHLPRTAEETSRHRKPKTRKTSLKKSKLRVSMKSLFNRKSTNKSPVRPNNLSKMNRGGPESSNSRKSGGRRINRKFQVKGDRRQKCRAGYSCRQCKSNDGMQRHTCACRCTCLQEPTSEICDVGAGSTSKRRRKQSDTSATPGSPDQVTEQIQQNSAARILQELPRYNWLEQKILQKAAYGQHPTPANPALAQPQARSGARKNLGSSEANGHPSKTKDSARSPKVRPKSPTLMISEVSPASQTRDTDIKSKKQPPLPPKTGSYVNAEVTASIQNMPALSVKSSQDKYGDISKTPRWGDDSSLPLKMEVMEVEGEHPDTSVDINIPSPDDGNDEHGLTIDLTDADDEQEVKEQVSTTPCSQASDYVVKDRLKSPPSHQATPTTNNHHPAAALPPPASSNSTSLPSSCPLTDSLLNQTIDSARTTDRGLQLKPTAKTQPPHTTTTLTSDPPSSASWSGMSATSPPLVDKSSSSSALAPPSTATFPGSRIPPLTTVPSLPPVLVKMETCESSLDVFSYKDLSTKAELRPASPDLESESLMIDGGCRGLVLDVSRKGYAEIEASESEGSQAGLNLSSAECAQGDIEGEGKLCLGVSLAGYTVLNNSSTRTTTTVTATASSTACTTTTTTCLRVSTVPGEGEPWGAPLDLCLKKTECLSSVASRAKGHPPVQMVLPQVQHKLNVAPVPPPVAGTVSNELKTPDKSCLPGLPVSADIGSLHSRGPDVVMTKPPPITSLTSVGSEFKVERCYPVAHSDTLDLCVSSRNRSTTSETRRNNSPHPRNTYVASGSPLSDIHGDISIGLAISAELETERDRNMSGLILSNDMDLSLEALSDSSCANSTTLSPSALLDSPTALTTSYPSAKTMTDAELDQEFQKHLIEFKALEKLAERKAQEQMQVAIMRKRKAEMLRIMELKKAKRDFDRAEKISARPRGSESAEIKSPQLVPSVLALPSSKSTTPTSLLETGSAPLSCRSSPNSMLPASKLGSSQDPSIDTPPVSSQPTPELAARPTPITRLTTTPSSHIKTEQPDQDKMEEGNNSSIVDLGCPDGPAVSLECKEEPTDPERQIGSACPSVSAPVEKPSSNSPKDFLLLGNRNASLEDKQKLPISIQEDKQVKNPTQPSPAHQSTPMVLPPDKSNPPSQKSQYVHGPYYQRRVAVQEPPFVGKEAQKGESPQTAHKQPPFQTAGHLISPVSDQSLGRDSSSSQSSLGSTLNPNNISASPISYRPNLSLFPLEGSVKVLSRPASLSDGVESHLKSASVFSAHMRPKRMSFDGSELFASGTKTSDEPGAKASEEMSRIGMMFQSPSPNSSRLFGSRPSGHPVPPSHRTQVDSTPQSSLLPSAFSCRPNSEEEEKANLFRLSQLRRNGQVGDPSHRISTSHPENSPSLFSSQQSHRRQLSVSEKTPSLEELGYLSQLNPSARKIQQYFNSAQKPLVSPEVPVTFHHDPRHELDKSSTLPNGFNNDRSRPGGFITNRHRLPPKEPARPTALKDPNFFKDHQLSMLPGSSHPQTRLRYKPSMLPDAQIGISAQPPVASYHKPGEDMSPRFHNTLGSMGWPEDQTTLGVDFLVSNPSQIWRGPSPLTSSIPNAGSKDLFSDVTGGSRSIVEEMDKPRGHPGVQNSLDLAFKQQKHLDMDMALSYSRASLGQGSSNTAALGLHSGSATYHHHHQQQQQQLMPGPSFSHRSSLSSSHSSHGHTAPGFVRQQIGAAYGSSSLCQHSSMEMGPPGWRTFGSVDPCSLAPANTQVRPSYQQNSQLPGNQNITSMHPDALAFQKMQQQQPYQLHQVQQQQQQQGRQGHKVMTGPSGSSPGQHMSLTPAGHGVSGLNPPQLLFGECSGSPTYSNFSPTAAQSSVLMMSQGRSFSGTRTSEAEHMAMLQQQRHLTKHAAYETRQRSVPISQALPGLPPQAMSGLQSQSVSAMSSLSGTTRSSSGATGVYGPPMGGPGPSPSGAAANSACRVCGKMAVFLCSSCRRVWYCNQQCQTKHWSAHAAECKPLT